MRHVEFGAMLGLGSGRAATAFTRTLARQYEESSVEVRCVATSMQIRLVAEELGLPIADIGNVAHIDAAFDGADQIDEQGNMIKGGGGALLLEKVVISLARRVIIMADDTKFARRLSIPVPVEVHPSARLHVATRVTELGAMPTIRLDARGYPAFTENGNIVLDCDFGELEDPARMGGALDRIAGVMEHGLFTSRAATIYRAARNGEFTVTGPARRGARGRRGR